jgi:hypothetical protein
MKTNLWLLLLILLFPTKSPAQTRTVTDIEGNVYRTIKVGNQVWMAENLKTTKFNDGTLISLVTNSSAWGKSSQPAYCWYNNDVTNKKFYGALYNWFVVETGKLCPVGWHVPSDKYWLSETYLPSGYRDENGVYWLVNNTSFYWTSTECSTTEAYYAMVLFDGSEVKRDYTFKKYGIPVRCVMNENH